MLGLGLVLVLRLRISGERVTTKVLDRYLGHGLIML